jgi:hypothetical protein
MGTDEHGTLPDERFPLLGFAGGETGALEGPRDAPGQVASSFSKARRQRPIGHDGPDAGHDQSHRGDEMGAELAQAGRRPRILDFGAWRGVGRTCQRPFLVVRLRHD